MEVGEALGSGVDWGSTSDESSFNNGTRTKPEDPAM